MHINFPYHSLNESIHLARLLSRTKATTSTLISQSTQYNNHVPLRLIDLNSISTQNLAQISAHPERSCLIIPFNDSNGNQSNSELSYHLDFVTICGN